MKMSDIRKSLMKEYGNNLFSEEEYKKELKDWRETFKEAIIRKLEKEKTWQE